MVPHLNTCAVSLNTPRLVSSIHDSGPRRQDYVTRDCAHIVPADHTWVTRAIGADTLTSTMLGLDLRYPEVTEAHHPTLARARQQLEQE